MERGNAKPRETEIGADPASRLPWILLAILQTIMLVELVVLLRAGQWLNGLQVATIMGLTLAPVALGSRLPIKIPPEFQMLSIAFVFASLFLGEIQSYYELVWWWDVSLHATSGLLFGIVGFLLVYVLNENERIDISLRPRFVALFAFVFAIAVGALWEVFEYTMDQALGLQMQKPRLGDPSGLTDAMWDLIFDTLGAFLISAFGWWYMIREQRSFIENWVRKFNKINRKLFRDRQRAPSGPIHSLKAPAKSDVSGT
jgi:uncharacterized membrane protein YjdF